MKNLHPFRLSHKGRSSITTRLHAATAVLGAGAALAATSAHAGLVSADGGMAVYDSTTNLTWTSNANLFASQYGSLATIIADANGANGGAGLSTGIVKASDFNSSGTMTWAGANAWVYYLDVTAYGGSTNWALPTTVDNVTSLGYANGVGTNPSPSSSQLAQLFYGGLGQVAVQSINTTHNAAYALFSGVQSGTYWSGTRLGGTQNAWSFDTGFGNQAYGNIVGIGYALAVTPGAISPVPVPGAVWLLGSGLFGLVGVSRRRLGA